MQPLRQSYALTSDDCHSLTISKWVYLKIHKKQTNKKKQKKKNKKKKTKKQNETKKQQKKKKKKKKKNKQQKTNKQKKTTKKKTTKQTNKQTKTTTTHTHTHTEQKTTTTTKQKQKKKKKKNTLQYIFRVDLFRRKMLMELALLFCRHGNQNFETISNKNSSSNSAAVQILIGLSKSWS